MVFLVPNDTDWSSYLTVIIKCTRHQRLKSSLFTERDLSSRVPKSEHGILLNLHCR